MALVHFKWLRRHLSYRCWGTSRSRRTQKPGRLRRPGPASLMWEDVATVDAEVVKGWATVPPISHKRSSLIVIGAGPPCSTLDRKGALKDERSCLFAHVARILELVKQAFPWCQVRLLMESAASTHDTDRLLMSASVDLEPVRIDAAGVSPAALVV